MQIYGDEFDDWGDGDLVGQRNQSEHLAEALQYKLKMM